MEEIVLYFKWQVLKTFVQKKVHIQFTMEPKPLWSRIDNQKPLRISIGYNSHVLRDKGIYIIPMMTEGEKIGMKIIKGGQNLPGIGNWSAKNWFRHHWIQFLRLWQKFELSKKIHFIQWNLCAIWLSKAQIRLLYLQHGHWTGLSHWIVRSLKVVHMYYFVQLPWVCACQQHKLAQQSRQTH